MKKAKKIILIILILLIVVGGGAFFVLWNQYNDGLTAVSQEATKEITFEIAKGESFQSVLERLIHENLVKEDWPVMLYTRLNGFEGMQAGKYVLSDGMDVEAILDTFSSGSVIDESIKVTIPEGLDVRQIGEIFEEEGFFTQEEFVNYVKDMVPPFLEEDTLRKDVKYGMEGFLFPSTYQFEEGATVETVVDRMYTTYIKVYNEELEKASGDLPVNLDQYEITTLASIIEEESLFDEDRPKISGVFYNRLEDDMLLQSCVTVIYAIGEHRTKLYYRDLEIDDPYNTYQEGDLPPGPIAAPGRSSIAAALNPADISSKYFVSTPSGTVLYGDTLREHEQNIADSKIFE